MICRPFRDAADRVPGARHCGRPDERTPHCTCGHRTPETPTDEEQP